MIKQQRFILSSCRSHVKMFLSSKDMQSCCFPCKALMSVLVSKSCLHEFANSDWSYTLYEHHLNWQSHCVNVGRRISFFLQSIICFSFPTVCLCPSASQFPCPSELRQTDSCWRSCLLTTHFLSQSVGFALLWELNRGDKQ